MTDAAEQPIPTFERLARVLDGEGLTDMAERARNLWYDEFLGPNETPTVLLVQDLADHDRMDLAERAKEGEWENTVEEAEAWAASDEGRATMEMLRANMARTNPLTNDDGQQLQLTDPERFMASVQFIQQIGGDGFAVAQIDEDDDLWAAQVQFDSGSGPVKYGVRKKRGPEEAVENLAITICSQVKPKCPNCRKEMRLSKFRGIGQLCMWKRIGTQWIPGCVEA